MWQHEAVDFCTLPPALLESTVCRNYAGDD